jgi:hypothetical protein
MKKIFTIIIASSLGFMAMAQDRKVAVFDPAGSIPNSTKEIVREEISSVIVNALGYTVLERALINKVLEENKFQAGGLVDDSQISEMGKRMGANFAFVSSLTIMENGNYYISCKMIDVLSARIEKQKTARTTQGSNDLVNVVEKMVADMFVSTTQKTSEGSVQNVAPNKDNSNSRNSQNSQPRAQQQPVEKPLSNANIGISSCRECGIEIMSHDLFEAKTGLENCNCPEGWRLPTRRELECICRAKKRVGNLKTNRYSNYFTSEFDNKGKVYIRSFDDCEESRENTDKEKGWVRCVR